MSEILERVKRMAKAAENTVEYWKEHAEGLDYVIQELQAENTELKKDKKRLDYLEDHLNQLKTENSEIKESCASCREAYSVHSKRCEIWHIIIYG
jgi:cell shape-determining protein MreC